MATGIIYLIQNGAGREFVGTTTQELSRIWTTHKSLTRRGRRSPLHDDMRRLGDHHFSIKHLETVPINQLRTKQQWWISSLKSSVPYGYNQSLELGGCRANLTTPEIKKILKLSKTEKQESIARLFCVSQATISRILARKIYK